MNYLSDQKARPFIIVILTIGIIYNIYFYRESLKMEKVAPQNFVVEKQYCGYRKNNSIEIRFKENLYTVRVGSRECSKYAVGAEIKLVYNDTYDYFYKQDGLRTAWYRLFFFPITLLVYIIPWKRIFKKNSLH